MICGQIIIFQLIIIDNLLDPNSLEIWNRQFVTYHHFEKVMHCRGCNILSDLTKMLTILPFSILEQIILIFNNIAYKTSIELGEIATLDPLCYFFRMHNEPKQEKSAEVGI